MAKKATAKTAAKLVIKISVYDLMQAERVDGKWDKKKAVLQTTTKVYDEYAETYNANFENSGSYYELNKNADAAYKKAVAEKQSTRKK